MIGSVVTADHVVRAADAAAELNAARLDVRARDVQLDRGDALGVRENLRDLGVLVDRAAADVHHHHGAMGPQLGQPLGDEPVHADALQADGVDHAGRRLDDARRHVAFALGEKETLHAHRAQRRQIDRVGVLDAVAETAARGNERVLQRQRANTSRQIRHVRLQAPGCTTARVAIQCASSSQTTSRALNVGPAMHERTK
jgi:hypothetical protein